MTCGQIRIFSRPMNGRLTDLRIDAVEVVVLNRTKSWGYGHPVNNVNKNGNNNNARNNNNNAWNNHHHHQENNNKNNQKPGGKKKEKVNKRELPENNQFHCEVCDRSFKSEEKYQEHVSEHTECSVPGCRYVAAPKLVKLHYNTNLLSPFDNATTVMAGVPESSARLACDFVIAGTSLHSPSETLDSLVDDDICKHLRRCFFPGRGRPALPKVQLTNRLLLQLKLLQAEGKKNSKDVSKWFDMLFPDVSYPSTRLSGALDRLEKKVQAVQREDGDIDSFLKTEVDFDFVSSSLSKQHRTGVAKKIWSMDTAEDIKKWIADRKRNYPSEENLARKEKERAEKTARGELITNKQFGKIRGRGQGRGQGCRGHPYRGRGGHRGNDHSHDDTEESQTESNRLTGADGPMNGSLTREEGVNGKGSCSQEKAAMQPPAKKRKMGDDAAEGSRKEKGDSRDPLSALISSGDDSSSDGDSTTPVQNLGGGLSSLMASYDDPQKEDGKLTVGAEGSSSHRQAPSIDAPRHQDGNSQRGFEPAEEETFAPRPRHRETDPDWVRRNRRCQQQKYRKNTLLERLLADEIRHERNVLLQCVHYIVNNNFLGALDGKTDIVGK
ncbi:hypothetical protein ACOMHN_060159 [Nucella lapillus]